MKRTLTRSTLIAAGLAAIACSQHKHGPKITGEFHRYGTQMSQGGMVLPELPDAQLTNFPSAVKFDDANGFQVDGGVFEIRGHYRLERDSIFLQQENGGATRLAFAGRLFNDTLHLHWIPDYDVGPDSHEAEWQLFFVRSR